MDEWPRVSTVLRDMGVPIVMAGVHALQRGRLVDSICTLLAQNELPQDDLETWYQGVQAETGLENEICRPFIDGFQKAQREVLRDWEVIPSVRCTNGCKGAVNNHIVSKAWGYIGHYDLLFNRPGKRRALVDLKSGGWYEAWVRFQTALYDLAIGERCERFALRLPGDGNYRLELLDDAVGARDRDKALILVQAWRIRQELAKNAIY